jgi:hypothetical protein
MRGYISDWTVALSWGWVETVSEGSIYFHLRGWAGGDPAHIRNGLEVECDIETVKGKGKYRHKTQQRAANVRPIVEPPEPDEEVDF